MSYPVTQESLLVNSITANTTVAIVSGMQVSTTTFNTAAGLLGTITLSPVQPTATNVEFKAGSQVLQIAKINFQAAFGLVSGEVSCSGSATDQNGGNNTPFQKQIASWSN
ncbi:hypothetical protein ACWGOQ_0002650 [Aquimarina sp. M1]